MLSLLFLSSSFVLLLSFFTCCSSASPLSNVERTYENVVKYDLIVSEGLHNPDGGKARLVYFMNGKFASEVFTINEGATLELCVTSNISVPFTLHGHGLFQQGTPWMDGVPGVTQRMIQPGNTFTYRYELHQYGFYHLHAHSKNMQDDGLFMGLMIRPAPTRQTPFAQISNDPTDQLQLAHAVLNSHPLLINDWRHYTSSEALQIWEDSNIETLCAKSILINGQGSMVCPPAEELATIAALRGFGDVTDLGCLPLDNPIINPPVDGFAPQSDASAVPLDMWQTCDVDNVGAPLYKVEVDNALTSWAVFDLVNAGGLWEQRVSIDEHPMYIIAVEGEYVNVTEPVDVVSLLTGMRVQAAVKLDKEPGSAYTIRVASNVVPQIISGYAVLQYASALGCTELPAPAKGYPGLPASKPSMAYSSDLLTTEQGAERNATEFQDLGFGAAPLVPSIPPSNDQVKHTFFFDMARPNATIWTMNGTGLHQSLYEDNAPIIWDSVWRTIADGDSPILAAHSVDFVNEKDAVVDIVFLVPNQDSPPHPIHKHFNKFWVIGAGAGNFNWTSIGEAAKAIPENFNLVNPPLRDGYNTPPAVAATGGSWLAIRYVADNAGPMTVHCHISQHAATGMVAVILQAMDQLQVPPPYAEPSTA